VFNAVKNPLIIVYETVFAKKDRFVSYLYKRFFGREDRA
jgi:hypothetical protein